MRWRLVRNAAGELEWERREPVSTRVKQRAKYGYHSYAMAVDPEDIPKAKSILAQHGVNAEYNRHGEPKIESRSHRKKMCAALGFYDRSGGYGDQSPQNR